jgi:hypothetical protein
MQFSPVLTTVGARTCTTCRLEYVLIARLRCWFYSHILFHIKFYTNAGYHWKISLITTSLDCFGCQVTATLRAMRRLISWARTPTFVDRSAVFYCQLQFSGIWIKGGSLTPILNTGSPLTADDVDNPSFGLYKQSCKQPNTSWVCLKTAQNSGFSYHEALLCYLNKHLHRMGLTTIPVCESCQLEEETAFHFVCVCPTLATLRTRIFGKPIMNASEFAEVSASAILQFAFQSVD